jgi:hypothetical protein
VQALVIAKGEPSSSSNDRKKKGPRGKKDNGNSGSSGVIRLSIGDFFFQYSRQRVKVLHLL